MPCGGEGQKVAGGELQKERRVQMALCVGSSSGEADMLRTVMHGDEPPMCVFEHAQLPARIWLSPLSAAVSKAQPFLPVSKA